jgi:hypothetical protein
MQGIRAIGVYYRLAKRSFEWMPEINRSGALRLHS